MRKLSRYDLLHAVADHDIEEVRSLLRQAGSQHLSLPAGASGISPEARMFAGQCESETPASAAAFRTPDVA